MKVHFDILIKAIAATQDGKKLNPTSRFNDFILSCLEANTDEKSLVCIDDLESDFKYMIHELTKACQPLEFYSEQGLNAIK